MLQKLKSKSVRFALSTLALSTFMGAAVAAHAASLNIPLDPAGTELSTFLTDIKVNQAYKDMRNNVRTATMATQSAATPLEIPVAIAMASVMKGLIMGDQKAAMKDPNNPNSLGASLAPPEL